MTKSKNPKKSNIVYILTNEAMPGYVKIGKTGELPSRLKALDGSSTPLPFKCECAIKLQNETKVSDVEKNLHIAFRDKRVRKSREFFEVDYEQVVAALKIAEIVGGKDVTPTEIIAEDEEGKRAAENKEKRTIASVFSFDKVGIENGAQLRFKKQTNITATVTDAVKSKIECPEIPNQDSLSATAKIILDYKHGVQGPAYWEYEDPEHGWETLTERRDRLEQDEDR